MPSSSRRAPFRFLWAKSILLRTSFTGTNIRNINTHITPKVRQIRSSSSIMKDGNDESSRTRVAQVTCTTDDIDDN